MSQTSPTVFSLHYIGLKLKKGVTAEMFEIFVKAKGALVPTYPGWRWTLLKGLRGERQNQYLMLYEAENAACYSYYINERGEPTARAREFWKMHPEGVNLINTWKNMATFAELPTIFSTYTLLAENNHSSLPEGPNYQLRAEKEPIRRVVGLHQLALCAGVSPEIFDNFIIDNIHRVDDYPGWKLHVLKGCGGNRKEQYLAMLEIESLASLNAYHPGLDVDTQKSLQFMKEHPESEKMYDEWRKLASFPGAPQLYTDYVTVCGSL